MIEKLKQNKLVLIMFIIAILLIITGVTYSFYKIRLEGQKTHFVSSDLISFTYKESENKISITNTTPVSDIDGKKSNYFEFSVSSNLVKDMSVDYEISILKTSTTNSFNESDIKVYLTDENDNSLVEPVIISELEDNNKITNAKTIYQNNFTYNNSNEKQTHTYRLRIWLKNDVDLSKYTTKAETENGTNVTLENHTFKFKVNVNTYESGAANTLIALTDNKDNSGLYTITHEADSTLQIGTNESITEYRYRGASPKNYVTFNNEVWRIIGVFPVDDGTGKIENRIKLIRNASVGTQFWNSTQVSSTSSYNNWTRATLKTYLNTTYYNTLSNIDEQSMIGNAKYYLGGYTQSTGISKDMMYQYERKISGSNTYYYGTNSNSWTGKIGLMYISDYGYSASDTCTSNLSSYNDETCTSNNWLYNIKKNEWLLPQRSNYSGDVFNIDADGLVGFNSASNNNYAIRPTLYLKYNVQISSGDGTSSNPYKFTLDKNEDNSNANKPVLASNMIPVYYDETSSSWKKADINNKTMENRWYNYDNQIWANAVTITSDRLETYKNENPGTVIPMDDITTMWVWIPRFNAVTPSNYNGGTVALPNAIDVTFVKENETSIDAFTFGDKELSGFWYGKFETSTTDGKLGCTTTTCSNANNILIKPNLVSVTVNNVSSYFYAGRSMEQPNNSFGFVSSEVDTHMSKNNEWGAVAYLTQSIYGRCADSTTCIDIGINNNSSYKTGYGAPAGSSSSATNGAYNTTLGKAASTTNNIYGIYDMSGGRGEYVMGVYNNSKSASGFSDLPDIKYYNNYTTTEYQGHALYATKGWYYDGNDVLDTNKSWYVRGGEYNSKLSAGVFYYYTYYGSNVYYTVRYVITNE